MFKDEFKTRYKGIPFAIYKASSNYKETTVISHQHKEMEVIAITNGYADFYIGTNVYRASKGDVVITPPYQLHRIVISKDCFAEYDCICFDLSIINDKNLTEGLENGTLTISPIIKSSTQSSNHLFKYVQNAFNAYNNLLNGWELDVIGNMTLFFATLKRNDFIFKQTQLCSNNDFSKTVIDYITKHYFEPITSLTLSKEMYINNSYFCRIFKNTFGLRFTDYLLEFRLEKAKLLIEHTSKPLSQIAINVGFNSFSYFSKNFKKRYGISPLKHRKTKAV